MFCRINMYITIDVISIILACSVANITNCIVDPFTQFLEQRGIGITLWMGLNVWKMNTCFHVILWLCMFLKVVSLSTGWLLEEDWRECSQCRNIYRRLLQERKPTLCPLPRGRLAIMERQKPPWLVISKLYIFTLLGSLSGRVGFLLETWNRTTGRNRFCPVSSRRKWKILAFMY